MSYEIYRYIFIGAAILCGVMLITSVLLFILLKIPKVIGDLTGRTAKKGIENIRNQNEASGEKTYRSSHVNLERGKITDKISQSGRLMKGPSEKLGAMATEKIGTSQLASEETTVLNSENTTVLTEELRGGNETTVLDAADAAGNLFQIEYEITYIHTNEVITSEVN